MPDVRFVLVMLLYFGFVSDCSAQHQPKKEPAGQIEHNGTVYELAFFEDFEGDLAAWKTTDDSAWRVNETKGSRVFGLKQRKSNYQPKFRSPHNIALIDSRTFTDFVIEFDVKSTKDTGNHRDCCLFFNYQDPDNFYYIHFGAKPDPASGQIMIVKQAPRKPLTKNDQPVAWSNGWHRIRVAYDSTNGKIDAYFDDMENALMSATDNTFTKGQIGIGSFDDMNDFDNVRIYQKKNKPK